MYGKDFHQWREAQDIIRQIEAEDPEVRRMVKQACGEAKYLPYPYQPNPPLQSLERTLQRQQYEWNQRGIGASPFGNLFGGLLGS